MNPQQKVNFVGMKYTDQNGYLDVNKTPSQHNPPSTMQGQREVTDAENSGGIELGLLQVKDLYQIACPNQGGTVV